MLMRPLLLSVMCALAGPALGVAVFLVFRLDDGAVTGSTVREHCYLRHSANRLGGAFSAAVMGRPRVVRITANQGETL